MAVVDTDKRILEISMGKISKNLQGKSHNHEATENNHRNRILKDLGLPAFKQENAFYGGVYRC